MYVTKGEAGGGGGGGGVNATLKKHREQDPTLGMQIRRNGMG